MERIEKPKPTEGFKIKCPKCGEEMEFDAKSGVGWCASLTCQVYFVESEPSKISSDRANIFKPMIKEAQNHLGETLMQKELELLGITVEEAKNLGMGYYPPRYWVRASEESKFGTVLFPVKDWRGEIMNIIGKDIGRDEKLDLKKAIRLVEYRKWKGAFNAEAFWNKEIHIYLNPTDCVIAIKNGENAIGICEDFEFPPIFPPEKVTIHPSFEGSEQKLLEHLKGNANSAEIKISKRKEGEKT